ncbi:restriction endonuclease subunit S [Larkinella punicea]|uniref:Restriction endonuclease subunit M n=1 Tax=Larkinella punicea TaxID=2315727 RepID=A0A368JMH6_9BACT|nr:restriction endonuclease subunit S [Larkinella punicea]RCR68485.1 restriction endonuclease subunit M [Larkinella punicea]
MKTGWEVKQLNQVCEKITDGTHQTPTYFQDGIVFLSSKNVTSGKIDWINVKYIDAKQHVEMHKRVAPRLNDILLAKNGTTGVAAIVDKDVVFDIYVSLALLRVKEEVLPSFMLYFINSPLAKKQFNRRLKGIGVPNLHLEEIREVEISYPKSLPEQQRIVAILDEAFAAIDQAKANAEKNLQNARALFESYLQSVFANSGEGWEFKKVKEVAKHSLGKMLDKAKNQGIPQRYLRNINVRWFKTDLSDLLEMRFRPEETEKYTAQKGDVLICEGGYPGRAAIWEEDYPIYFQKAIHRVRFNKQEYNKLFVYFLYLSDKNGNLKDYCSGAGIQHFTGEALGRFIMPLPPLSEAKSIVAKLDALSIETKKLEAIYRQKLADLDELKKAILQKAFRGELKTAQAAELV